MLLRFSLSAAGALLLAAGANAQSTAKILPVPGVKNAGTYHVATGTWTRGPQSLALGTYDTIYDNSCSGNWYVALESLTFHDDGRIPSTGSPMVGQTPMPGSNYTVVSFPGTDDSYSINWFEFGYCTGVAPPMTAWTAFYGCYDSCADATLLTPDLFLQISGLPGNGGTGVGCWIAGIDLLNAGFNFTIQGDCDGIWQGTASLDNFGYMYMQSTPDATASSGPLLTGDPDGYLVDGPGTTGCCVGCNTVFWAAATPPPSVAGTCTEGSGLNNADNFEIDNYDRVLGTFTYNNCYWFGGYAPTNPHASIHMEIAGETSDTTPCGVKYCDGNILSGNTCPCGNDNTGGGIGFAGCANGFNAAGGVLDCEGIPSLTADTLLLKGSGLEPSGSAMFFQGPLNFDAFGAFVGDGVRCAGGPAYRLMAKTSGPLGDVDSSHAFSLSAWSAFVGAPLVAGDIMYYQLWYRDSLSMCGNGSNATNGVQVTWQM